MSNHSFLFPIEIILDSFNRVKDINCFNCSFSFFWNCKSQIVGSKLCCSEVRELIDSHFPGVDRVGIVFVDFDKVSKEDGLSVFFLSHFGVLFVVLSFVLLEGIRGRGCLMVEGKECDGCE